MQHACVVSVSMHIKLRMWIFVNVICSLINVVQCTNTLQTCPSFKLWLTVLLQKLQQPFCPANITHKSLYVLYDVNPAEGFNLRRDVYIRLAVFIQNLQQTNGFRNICLVLPPWRHLYHWKSRHILQNHLPWSNFFNIESLKLFAPVLDYAEFLQEITLYDMEESPLVPVHKVLQLQHFKDMFENGVFYDKWQFADDCHQDKHILRGSYLKELPLSLKESQIQCVRFQGYAKMLQHVLRKVMQELGDNVIPKVIAIINAEVVLHDQWANKQYWEARRSMRFAEHLIQLANNYRLKYLNSSNSNDKVQRPQMWKSEISSHRGKALGGPYIGAHLRRGDFLHGREKTTPSLKSAAIQLKYYLKKFNLSTIYLATDATSIEVKNFKSYLPHIQVLRYTVENQQESGLTDGALAIIDQLLCAHARFFVGTYESTFTYRIYEEREILGFPSNMTFNTFCQKSTMENCSKNTIWSIIY